MSWIGDRGWMYRRATMAGYLCLDYCGKVEEFLDFAYSKKAIVERMVTRTHEVVFQIKCPCKECKNYPYMPREVVKQHLVSKGFMPDYYTWYQHGETFNQDVGQCSNQMEEDEDVDGCRQMVLDNMNANGFNPTFQSNASMSEEQPPNSFAKEFYDMLKDSDEPLYSGCKDWTKLQAAARILNLKSDCNVPNSTINKMLPLFKNMFLSGNNNLPVSFDETKRILKPLHLPKERIDACKNHCMLFYKDDKLLIQCRYCGESRYKRNKVSNLVLTYMPIGPRLKRMYISKKTAKQMTWYHDHPSEEGSMVHPRDSQAWKHFDTLHPLFAGEIRNVRLGLCTDGFSPSNSSSHPYSLWPVFLTIYNLPPWMCLKDSYVKLCLVIPGRKSPGQNLDVFLQPLIDELKDLWFHGVEVYDAYRKQNFTMRAILLWTVSDFPAYAMLSGWSTHGRLACPYCMCNTHSFRLKFGGKPCWFDCHRRFLPISHPFRRDRKGFRDNQVVLSSTPPSELSGEQILLQISNIPTVYEGTPYSPNNPKPLGFGQTHNWVKKNIFWELPYWHNLLIRHNLDVMHIEKNVFENLFQTIMDTSKTKDNIKARKDIEEYCDRPTLHLQVGNNGKVLKPKASYTLNNSELKKVCKWLKEVKFPDGYASNIGGCVNVDECIFYSFKSHEGHVFMQRLLPIALRGIIPNAIWDAITELCTFFRAICSRVLHLSDLKLLEKSIVVTICKLEKYFPPGFFDSMEHLVIHLAKEAILGGPVQYRWMYLYERKLGILKKTVRNQAKVEGSIVESYLAHELSTYCALQFDPTIETRINREPRNFAPDIPSSSRTDHRLSIFKVPSRRLHNNPGKRRAWVVDELHKAHTHILLNCEEVLPFIWNFDDWIREREPNIEAGELAIRREEQFAEWLQMKVTEGSSNTYEHLADIAYGPLNYVHSHNGYFIKGYKFHTSTHCNGRVTQNSGVCVKGACYDEFDSDYYGVLDEILEVEYHSCLGTCVVVLFKCTWFDPARGVKVDQKHNLVDIKHMSKGCINDPFILASQAEQVYYLRYPSMTRELKDWWAVVKTKPRGVYELAERASEANDDENGNGEIFFQENERLLCTTSTTDDIGLVSLARGEIQEIVEEVGDDIDISDGEEEETGYIDGNSDSDIDLNISDDDSDF